MRLEEFANQLKLLPDYVGHHLLLTLTALGVGIAISLPLSIYITRVRPLRGPVLALASIIQTIPSLALLALMVPLLSRIGFLPAVIALILYSMLPIIRNTVTGIEGIDPDLVEAGKGLGMTRNQLLLKVQLPLALPVIVAGIRTATVWVVGIATLSTPVGATSLGNYIFSGLQTQNHEAVVVGCVAAALLAIVLDLLIRAIEVGIADRSPAVLATSIVALGVFLTLGVSPFVASELRESGRPVARIGSKTFTEQYILAQVLETTLARAQYHVERMDGLGSTVAFDALAEDRIDCYVDYSGTLWANHMKREDNPGADRVLEEMTDWLIETHGVVCLGALGFENAYALAVRSDVAGANGIETIQELAVFAPEMKIGGDYEFFSRPEWESLEEVYHLKFQEETSLDSTLMYQALVDGEVDVISAFSSDGRIAAFDLTVLEDPKQALPPYDAILLLSSQAAKDPGIVEALRPLIGSIDDSRMRRANMIVDVDKGSIGEAARYLRGGLDDKENRRTN